MKILLYIPLFVFLLCASCKKSEVEPVDFDVANKILRIRITSKNDVPFDVSVNRIVKEASINFSVGQTATSATGSTQTDGKPFEFAYTPTIGTTININIESQEDLLTTYIFYKGLETWKVYMQKKADGLYHGTFSYKVVD